ncbi:hypothetical protein D3C77_574700 [compost metagenome]
MFALGSLAPLPDPLDNRWQTVMAAGKAGAAKAGYRGLVTRFTQALDQAQRVDEEGADDRRIQALVIEHQHRFVQARP